MTFYERVVVFLRQITIICPNKWNLVIFRKNNGALKKPLCRDSEECEEEKEIQKGCILKPSTFDTFQPIVCMQRGEIFDGIWKLLFVQIFFLITSKPKRVALPNIENYLESGMKTEKHFGTLEWLYKMPFLPRHLIFSVRHLLWKNTFSL